MERELRPRTIRRNPRPRRQSRQRLNKCRYVDTKLNKCQNRVSTPQSLCPEHQALKDHPTLGRAELPNLGEEPDSKLEGKQVKTGDAELPVEGSSHSMPVVVNHFHEPFSGNPPSANTNTIHLIDNPPSGVEVYGPTIRINPGAAGEAGDAEQNDPVGPDHLNELRRQGIRGPTGAEEVPEDNVPLPGDLYGLIGTSAAGPGQFGNDGGVEDQLGPSGESFFGKRPVDV